ncbi:MAG: DUF421 domain-containing protein [Methylocapsa sp.]|nr:DUF421 domain-containing protein [Methylocapsa sp.]
MNWSEAIFGTPGGSTIGSEAARAAIVFCYGLVVLRLAGRRVFGKLSALDTTVAIIVGSCLARVINGNAPLAATLVAVTLLIALHWLFIHLAARWRFFSRLIEGRPILLASEGELVPRMMKRSGVSDLVLHEALREKGIEQISGVRAITLEPSGKITIVKGDQDGMVRPEAPPAAASRSDSGQLSQERR